MMPHRRVTVNVHCVCGQGRDQGYLYHYERMQEGREEGKTKLGDQTTAGCKAGIPMD